MRGLAVALAVAGTAFNPTTEAQNYSKINERAAIYSTPAAQLLLRQVGTSNELAPRRHRRRTPSAASSRTLCARGEDGCAGEFRLYDWNGIVKPVLFTRATARRCRATCGRRGRGRPNGPAW